ncbi:hypothetical protein [Sinorhizobium alkalisoli]|uniref:Uncharacterized protein n=1 Tax=Sinorhizobium alkalisoli TaxID=1752398 RepID=A0A1E3VEH1_9HYPH|nr:hypothetical protein [Sinorhizobium alkalisoli]MCA1494521.1 hypothetical protein [Ensifer sp. NBAIM29]MCG5480254.1 hypothetical protein [Sinorhizobium alkalisoli]ODR91276.1 hypothetical protein A8M32_10765 [Sinorhizobium alkalisoli]QFI66643.1 hypothetical protein EKH55_1769 [Sinorhizobium alkalisoli]
MTAAQDFTFDPIGPNELELIDKIFQVELQVRRISRKCAEAEALAARLIHAYQSGIRNADALSALARSNRHHRTGYHHRTDRL